ncbi:alpha-taxilin isoform X2 [Zophobas morio]|uniref:alpha-taxilin isoform X2 n=1 Tax=Zophobas morio TaxID=2755281 RepID=UPI003083CF46
MEEQHKAAAAAGPSLGSSSTRKKQEDKYRKKDPKSWENIIKFIASMEDSAKFLYIETKYKELYNEDRQLNVVYQQLVRQNAALQKEMDHNQTELAKSIVARARLENLCRELQKQNKQIKEENMAKIKEEEERRKEVSLKFADKLNDINSMMEDNKEKSDKLREENLKMTAKLADLYAQFQKREEDISKMSQQLELERQFSQATLTKMELEIKAEKELHLQEQTLMKGNLEKSEANCAVLLSTVKGLQDHIDVYKHQYEDFESTMSKSTKVFDNFKFEIANMTKQVNHLEEECLSWKQKFQQSMKALVEMSEQKKGQDAHLRSVDKKIEQLNKLCRQLQSDRSSYLKLLKTHGIEPPPSAIPKGKPADNVVPKTSTADMTEKEKELEALKENLKAVQDELTRLNVDEIEKSEPTKTDSSSQDMEDETLTTNVQFEEEKISNEKSVSPVSSQKVVVFIDSDKGVIEEVNLIDSQPIEKNTASTSAKH